MVERVEKIWWGERREWRGGVKRGEENQGGSKYMKMDGHRIGDDENRHE